jgi:hypothetical protein
MRVKSANELCYFDIAFRDSQRAPILRSWGIPAIASTVTSWRRKLRNTICLRASMRRTLGGFSRIPGALLVTLGTWTGRRSCLAFCKERGMLSATAPPLTSLLFLVTSFGALSCGTYGVPAAVSYLLMNKLMFTRLATLLGGIPSTRAWPYGTTISLSMRTVGKDVKLKFF